jgi:hypothetical protein
MTSDHDEALHHIKFWRCQGVELAIPTPLQPSVIEYTITYANSLRSGKT